jgi:nitrite reductase/ring-hydroxylating ferredoxin subunit
MNRYKVAALKELQEKRCMKMNVSGIDIALFYVDGKCYAYNDRCPHEAAPMHKGVVCGTRLPAGTYEYVYGMEDQVVRCPWHGWEFDIKTGKHLANTDVKLRSYRVEEDGEDVYVLLNR